MLGDEEAGREMHSRPTDDVGAKLAEGSPGRARTLGGEMRRGDTLRASVGHHPIAMRRNRIFEGRMTIPASRTDYRGSDAGWSFVIGLNICLAGIYTNFAVNVGGYWIPGVPVIAGAMLLVPHMRFLVPHKRDLVWVGALIVFLTVSLVAGGSGASFFDTRLTSWLQIIAALGCAHIILCAMHYPQAVRNTLFLWMIFIVVGVILETVFSPMRELSDAFRHAAFEGRFLYFDGDARDLRDYGFVRPKLFTQEPSHVAKAFVAFGAGWYVLSSSRRRLMILLGCTILATLFLGSPIVLLVLPLAWFLDRIASGRAVSGIVAAAIPALGIIAIVLTRVFSTRIASILSGKDASFFERSQGPYEVALRVIDQYPIFGVGIGAKEALLTQVQIVYSSHATSWQHENYLTTLSNACANSLSYFGVAGALVFYFLLAQWAKGFGIQTLVSLPVMLLFFQLDGALEGLRMWGLIAVVLGCYSMTARSSPPTVETSSTRGVVRETGAVRSGVPSGNSRSALKT